jgi:hypothetical protein
MNNPMTCLFITKYNSENYRDFQLSIKILYRLIYSFNIDFDQIRFLCITPLKSGNPSPTDSPSALIVKCRGVLYGFRGIGECQPPEEIRRTTQNPTFLDRTRILHPV